MASSPLFQALRVAYNDDSPDGYWGEKTSTLNFCEEDYVVSYYCAEVCNTLTNLLFLWLGFKGVYNCVSQGHPRIFLIAYLGYVIVGLGSTAFHTSLKYPMQLIDELSMIYTTCLMVFATFSFSKSSKFSVLLGSGLVILAGFITSYYHITKDPAFHQACYAALTATVVLRSLYVMETQLRPVLSRRNKDKANLILNTMWIMVGTGLGVFLMGFLIWNIDNAFCSQIRQWRRQLGLPWGALLEGHAWWHLMTGVGAYYYITWGIWLRRCLEGREDEYRLVWPRSLSSIPLVVKAKKAD
ncbi:alkaline phytoceramidase [Colletotrichum phormii]|uniref:Alkaline phytoceramidase n=1 Tax=Colletotrichum phormii TaxID=359342 RepID=A0AAI9ZU07_9PEZI|nr:alkaline phytoceramidase [Colletotrichum phormii]KAK1638146.1 alkaline phytoceramidase [Colletotrichum phormii]